MKASYLCKLKTVLFRFTLIELLVVIAIIAILSAILLPALGHARYTAKQITCVNNVKQMSVGLLNYTNDNDNWYPGTPNGRNAAMDISSISARLDYDLRPVFRTYFGADNLNSVMQDPLNYPAWQARAAKKAANDCDDFDKTSYYEETGTGYSFFFGRTSIIEHATDPSKNTGCTFTMNKCMLRAGDSFTPSYYSSKSFRIIMSDNVTTNHNNLYIDAAHQSRSGIGTVDGGSYRFIGPSKSNASFALDDGSVKIISYVSVSEIDRKLKRIRNPKTTSVIPLELGE